MLVEYSYPPRGGNSVRLLMDGDAAFAEILSAIEHAQQRVWLETYIFEPDQAGNVVRDAIARAAARGCETILLLDSWGSPRINAAYTQAIREMGGRVVIYNPALPWRKLGRKFAPFFHRDHRKILIVDEVGFCGGRNISQDYGGAGKDVFYDLTLRIAGPLVEDLADAFLRALGAATSEAPPRFRVGVYDEQGVTARVLLGNRRLGVRDLDLGISDALASAEKQCLLMTPYLIPPSWFLDLVMGVAERGVDVRLLTAGKSDVPFVQFAGRHLYDDLIRAGVRVYEMLEQTLHAKSVTVDGRFSIVGSYNIDVHGSRHNLEIGVGVTDTALAATLTQTFMQLTERARLVTPSGLKRRSLVARAVSWVLSALFRF